MTDERIDVLAVLRVHGGLDDVAAAVAELIEAAPNLSDYLDGYVMWQRKQGRDPVGLEIAENDIARFRAALARCGGAS